MDFNHRANLDGYVECEEAQGYVVNKSGVVRKISTTRKMNPHPDPDGYERIRIQINKKAKMLRVHRLAAQAFIPNPENKPSVNHKDGVKNNNHLENLEWVTHKENFQHAKATLRVGMHKFSVDSILMSKLQGLIDTLEEIKQRSECTDALRVKIDRALKQVTN